MSVATSRAEGDPAGSAAATGTPAGSISLTSGTVTADRCSVCDAALAPDQRYCVECGTRRGRPRFVLATATAAESAQRPAASGVARRAANWSGPTIAVALIALLLALGVGVLIGNVTAGSPSVRVLVSGGSAASSGSGSGSSGTSTAKSGGSSVKPGGSCTSGTPGCQNGKETGNFFPSSGG